MTHLLRAELRKITGRRLAWGFEAAALVLLGVNVVLLPIVYRLAPTSDTEDLQGIEPLLELLHTPSGYIFAAQQAVSAVLLMATILAAIAVANEYSWGTVTLTFTLEPRRSRVIVGKWVALVLLAMVGILLAILVGAALVILVQGLLPEGEGPWDGAWIPEVLRLWVLSVPAVAVWCALPIPIAVATRSPAAGAIGVVVIYVGDSILGLIPGIRDWLISTNQTALIAVEGVEAEVAGVQSSADLGLLRPGIYLSVVAMAAIVAAVWLVSRRDVT